MVFASLIYNNRLALLECLDHRIEEALRPYHEALDEFLRVLFQSTLPSSWRARWHAFVDQQAAEGFTTDPKSVREMEAWIEAWAKFCGLIPAEEHDLDGIEKAFDDAYEYSRKQSQTIGLVAESPGEAPNLLPPGDYSDIGEVGRSLDRLARQKDLFWKGAKIFATEKRQPLFLIEWNQKNRTPVHVGSSPGYTSVAGYLGSIELGDLLIKRYTRVGRAGAIDPKIDGTGGLAGTVYNEAFHAWFDQAKEARQTSWLSQIIARQYQFQTQSNHPPQRELAEEAMSEMIDYVTNVLASGAPVLDYHAALANRTWRQYLEPGHYDSASERFFNVPEAKNAMTEELFYATIWVLYNGNREPPTRTYLTRPDTKLRITSATARLERLIAMKYFFVDKFRQEWTAEQSARFVKPQEDLLEFLLKP